jgi:hypothetical protein
MADVVPTAVVEGMEVGTRTDLSVPHSRPGDRGRDSHLLAQV